MKKYVLYTCICFVLASAFTFMLSTSSSSFNTQAIAQPAIEVPFLREWAVSAHADAKAEAFSHWNEDEPREIPIECARCHSTAGYRDFIGADGSPAGQVDKPAPVGTTVECIACHNQTGFDLDRVVMPSGVEISGLGGEARCMQCHQGRASKYSIDEVISQANLPDLDTVNPDFEFINIHYYSAVAAKYGTITKSGYEYEDKSYDAHFAHITDFDPCTSCHYAHTQTIKLDECQECHDGVNETKDLKDIRMFGSLVDYDGDGDLEEGIYYEIRGMQEMLLKAIQRYAKEKVTVPIVYDLHKHPYFFVDLNGNGTADEEEVKFPNKYHAWTGRLLKAAYNYQLAIKDPGMFAHGGKYVIQLLYDSIEDLNAALTEPIDLAQANRIDDGHFAGSEEAFRHWDIEGKVPGECSKCHSAGGLPFFLKEGVTVSQPPSNGLKCTSCHDDLDTFSRYSVAHVDFPSGAQIDSGDADTNLCMSCHQGRESTLSVNALIEGIEEDAGSEDLHFLNVHFLAAGATYFGTDAKGGYEYSEKSYAGMFKHYDGFRQAGAESTQDAGCLSCHLTHGLVVNEAKCLTCHEEIQEEFSLNLRAIRKSTADYDGDGNVKEALADEIDTLRDNLYAAIQDYARQIVKTAIVYEGRSSPYFFTDSNEDGLADTDEASWENRYKVWTPKLLKAAYNYQYVSKDPGAFAHNGQYIVQLLYDSLEDIGADTEGLSRP
ncbi:MAG: cytochrome c3 family protein [bacterium]|nr:cytochrome c3 family protein [bacterium]